MFTLLAFLGGIVVGVVGGIIGGLVYLYRKIGP